jgi:iron complex transport system substrate-binding protein
VSRYGSVETEWVLEQNPEVIVCRAMGEGIRPYELDDTSILAAHADEIRELPGFAAVDAAANDRIYIITNDYAISPNYPTTVALLAKWFYPDLFEDVDPVAIHQEYMDLMGISFNVSEHGAFFYPSLS